MLLSCRAWDHVGSQDKIRKRAEGLKLKSKSYFIWACIPQRHTSNLRKLLDLLPKVLKTYNNNCSYSQISNDIQTALHREHYAPNVDVVCRPHLRPLRSTAAFSSYGNWIRAHLSQGFVCSAANRLTTKCCTCQAKEHM